MNEFTLKASDGAGVQCYSWPVAAAKATVQIAHGMGKPVADAVTDYARVAERLKLAVEVLLVGN